jgi:hypothetical protein
VPNPGGAIACPDANAFIDHVDDEAIAVDPAADLDPPAALAVVGVNDGVRDRLGYGKSDGLHHLVRRARG